MTIEQAAAKLRSREVSSVELTRESLRAIHAQQSRLNAFVTITEELALSQAARADEELARGMVGLKPLRGGESAQVERPLNDVASWVAELRNA